MTTWRVRYALQWESKNLITVSTAIQDWLTSRIAMEFMKQGAMLTVLSALLTALAWPAALLSATDFIDSTWTIAIDRSDKIGKLLAEILLGGLQGNRPVTLVGYSLGARVIFKCLQFLAETENNAELVEKVVLLGAPIAIKDENWEATRKMVAGRFVDAYSRNDWMLGVAFPLRHCGFFLFYPRISWNPTNRYSWDPKCKLFLHPLCYAQVFLQVAILSCIISASIHNSLDLDNFTKMVLWICKLT